MEKTIKFGDIEIKKQKFHQQYPIRSVLVKKDLNVSLATKKLKKN